MPLPSLFPEEEKTGLFGSRKAAETPGDIGPAVGLIQQRTQEVKSFRDMYKAGDVGLYPSRQTKIDDIPKFLFGPQMASYGVMRDWDSFQDVASNVWTSLQEEPLWTAIDIAALTLAAGGPIYRSYKMGAIGKALNQGFKYYANDAAVQALPNVLAKDKFFHWFDIAKTPEEEVKVLRSLNYLRDDVEVTNSMLEKARSQAYHHSRLAYLNTKGMQWDDYKGQLNLEAMKVADVMKLPHTDSQVVKQATENLVANGIEPPEISLLERTMYSFHKNFGQQMGSLQQDPSPVGQMRRMLHQRFDEFSKDNLMMNNVLPQVEQLNDSKFGEKMYLHSLSVLNPDLFAGKKLPDLNPMEKRIMDTWFLAAAKAQEKAKDLGLVSEKNPIVHLIGLTQSGVMQGEIPALVHANSLAEALYSPTLLHKAGSEGKQAANILERIERGDLQATATTQNLINGYMNDQMLMFNFETIRDLFAEVDEFGKLTKRYAIPAAEVMKGKSKAVHLPGYIQLDRFFANERFGAGRTAMQRIFSKHMDRLGIAPEEFFGPNGELPYVNESIMRHVFGKGGMWEQSQAASTGLLAFVTSIHKFSKAVMNPGSHLQNELGNFALASMAGFNMLDPTNVKLMNDMTDIFQDIHNAQVSALKAFNTNTPSRSQVLAYVSHELKKTGKVVKYGNQEVPIDVYAEGIVQNLYLEGAFDSQEAFGHLKRVYEENGMTDSARAVAKKVFTIYDSPAFEKTGLRYVADKAQKNYLAADIVPKLAMFTKLHAEGMTVQSAVTEVARRMPMYGVVGRYIAGSRSVALPWVTFPAEMVRIFKNNIIDNPIRVLPWLVLPGAVQSLLSGMGMAPTTPDAVEFAKRQLPFWAQTPGNVVTEGQDAAAMTAAGQGGLFGFLAGSRIGGGVGAAVGAAAGAAIPLALQAINNNFTDQEEANKQLRGAVLNWLPYTSFLPKTRSVDYEVNTISDAWGQLPAEPFAIVRALLEPVFGQTEFGEIKAPTFSAKVAKSFTNLLGFISPPWFQKYGFHSPTPDLGVMDLMVGKDARDPNFAKATGASINNFFPNVTNLRRLVVDTGMYNDSVTGRPGSPVFDFVLNTSGLWKSYEARGEILEANRMRVEQQAFGELRSYYAKQLTFYAENQEDQGIHHSIQAVFDSYNAEYMGDPMIANEKFGEWLKSQAGALGRHPALRGMSDEELTSQIEKSVKFASKMRGSSYDAWRASLAKERQVRALTDWQQYWNDMKDKYQQ